MKELQEAVKELRKAVKELQERVFDIYNHKGRKDAARLKLTKWFDKVGKLAGNAFQTVIDTADCNLLFGLSRKIR